MPSFSPKSSLYANLPSHCILLVTVIFNLSLKKTNIQIKNNKRALHIFFTIIIYIFTLFPSPSHTHSSCQPPSIHITHLWLASLVSFSTTTTTTTHLCLFYHYSVRFSISRHAYFHDDDVSLFGKGWRLLFSLRGAHTENIYILYAHHNNILFSLCSCSWSSQWWLFKLMMMILPFFPAVVVVLFPKNLCVFPASLTMLMM